MKTRIGFVSNSSSSSFVIVGVPIPMEKLYTKAIKRSCDCSVEGNPRFCPKCGNAFMSEQEEAIPEFKNGKIGRAHVIHGDGADSAYAGIRYRSFCTEDGFAKMPILDLVGEKEELRKILEPLGLWNEQEYGFWIGTIYS